MQNLACAAVVAACGVLVAVDSASADGLIPAEGEFTVDVDFSSLTLTPIGRNCLIDVDGTVDFTGTLDGTASAHTRALAFASCDFVGSNPPGAYRDVFRSNMEFSGTVDAVPTNADITYLGKTQIGGKIAALMIPSNGLAGCVCRPGAKRARGAVVGGNVLRLTSGIHT